MKRTPLYLSLAAMMMSCAAWADVNAAWSMTCIGSIPVYRSDKLPLAPPFGGIR